MTIDLSKVVFDNDFFTTKIPDGSLLVLNKVEEDFISEEKECVVKAINIQIQIDEDNVVVCPSIIGLGNDLMQITTNYKEHEGEVLTPENMAYCTLEIYE